MANEIDITVKSDSKGIDALSRDAKRAGKEVGDSLKEGFQEGEQAGGKAAKGIKDSFGDVFDSLSDLAGEAGGGVGDALTSGFSAAKGGLLAAGVAAGTFILEGIQAEIQEDKVGGMLAAQTGAAASAAEGLGDTAGRVFADNFGDSIDEVGDAMASVFENKLINTSAPQAAIEDITKRVMTLANVTGESFDDIGQAASRMVSNKLAPSVEAALDLIGKAQERGLNASGDLMDTLEEYSVKFHDLGLNGQQALGLIEQAMDGGARNTDIAADALKEFQLQASQLSGTARRGFQTLGLDADEMSHKVAQGGDSARQALDQVLDGLRAMPPGTERATAAVDLFGTKAEDLGASLYKLDLDTASDKFKDFAGSADQMMDKLQQSTSFWEKLGKGISEAAANVGEFLNSDFFSGVDLPDDVTNMINEIAQAQKEFDTTGNADALDKLAKKYPEAADKISAYIDKKREEKQATDDTTSSAQAYIETLDQMLAKQQAMADPVLALSDAQIGYQQALDDATESLNANGATLDINTQAGRDNKAALDDVASSSLSLAQAMADSGQSVSDVNAYLEQARGQLIDTAVRMGMTQAQAEAYANSLGLIPHRVLTSVELSANAAMENLAAYKRALDNIPRVITTTTQVRGANITSGSGGHYYLGQEHGGIAGAGSWWTAASGGQRHGSTLINEAGPELVELPNGSRVATAGATRALAESGALGGGMPAVSFNFRTSGRRFEDLFAEMINYAFKNGYVDVNVLRGGQ